MLSFGRTGMLYAILRMAASKSALGNKLMLQAS